jgi:hypothetical protein
MSIFGYLDRGPQELWMPAAKEGAAGPRFEGAVLTGQKSVEGRMREELRRGRGAYVYGSVEKYGNTTRFCGCIARLFDSGNTASSEESVGH